MSSAAAMVAAVGGGQRPRVYLSNAVESGIKFVRAGRTNIAGWRSQIGLV